MIAKNKTSKCLQGFVVRTLSAPNYGSLLLYRPLFKKKVGGEMHIEFSETEVIEFQPNNYFAQREVIKRVINYPPEQTATQLTAKLLLSISKK